MKDEFGSFAYLVSDGESSVLGSVGESLHRRHVHYS